MRSRRPILGMKGALTEIRPLTWSLSRSAANSWSGVTSGPTRPAPIKDSRVQA
jgi:hypothetical protein